MSKSLPTGGDQRPSRSSVRGFSTPRPPGRFIRKPLLMKLPSRTIPLLLASLWFSNLNAEQFTTNWEVEIPDQISDGKPQPNPLPPELPDFSVTETYTLRKDVVEAPPMPGLPPVEGRISVSVRKVVDPELPPLPEPPPPLPPDDAAVKAILKEFEESHKGTELVFLSATVYDQSRTLLRIYLSGGDGWEITAWSNIDFNHFSGFASYRTTSPEGEMSDVALLMGLGNIDTDRMNKLSAESGELFEMPRVPRLRDISEGPAYVIVEGKDTEGAALETLKQLHLLYEKEGTRMREAHLSRMAEEKKLRKHYLANPPKPKDVVLNYWRGKRPADAGLNGEAKP